MLSRTYVVLDIETTGLNPAQDKIIEIAAVRLKDGNIIREFNTLVNPGRPVPRNIQKLTGIDDTMVRGAPGLDEILPALLTFTEDAVLVAHNGKFDLAFLSHALGFNPWEHQPLLDTLVLSRILFPCLPSYRLGYLTQRLEIEVRKHHRALNDVLATVQLLNALWQATLALEKTLLKSMLKLTPTALQPWFQAALLTDSNPSLPAEVATTGLFAEIEISTASPPVPPEFCIDKIATIIKPGGLLASRLPGYEYRSQQVAMLQAVADALINNQYLAVEAGTGIGKSLAYLLPAIYWACHQGKRVAIATYTISLQEQLMYKDLPQLQELLPLSFKAALVKGRGNYICRLKLRDFLENPLISEEERFFILRVLHWLKQTTSGDWNELKFTPEEEVFKISLSAHKESCAGNACPYNDRCFVLASRLEAEAANILVLNHSLLLSDIKLNHQVLPSYPYLIIDEAHHLEEAATEHLGITISQTVCNSYYRRLGKRDINFSFLGRLWNLAKILNPEQSKKIISLIEELDRIAIKVQQAWQLFWPRLAELDSSSRGEQNSYSIRFTEHLKETPAWESMLAVFGELEASLTVLVSRLNRLRELLNAIAADEIAAEAGNFSNTFTQHILDLTQVLDADPSENINWLEKSYNGQLILRLAPLKTGPLLAELLFSQKKAVILTSATITVNNSFTYFREQVGLDILASEQVLTCQVASPFDYQSQAIVCAVKGLPNPAQLNDSEYAHAIVPVIANILAGVNGRVLILCTSHRFLRQVNKNLSAATTDSNYTILAQGVDGNRNQLLEEFRRIPGAVLLGTSSFWEGIDLPGEFLRCVIIPRLPFPSPGVPAFAARMEHMASSGLNSFTALSLPQAIIRFRQGFGRLIRRATDRGALVVLDQRVLSKRYGHYFLESLPPVTKLQLTPDELSASLPGWFKIPSTP